jgi:hypothetical protein
VTNPPRRVHAIRRASFLVAALATFVPTAEATKVHVYSLVELLDEADVVVLGRVVESTSEPPTPGDDGRIRIRVETLKVFKGDVGKESMFQWNLFSMISVPEYLTKPPVRVLIMGRKSKAGGEFEFFTAFQGIFEIVDGRIRGISLLGEVEESLLVDVLEDHYRPKGADARQVLVRRVFALLQTAEPYFGEMTLYALLAAIGEPRSIPDLADRFRKAAGEHVEEIRISIAKTILDIGGEAAHAAVLALYREEHGASPWPDALRPGIWFDLFGHGRVKAAVPILRKALEQSPDEDAVLENVFDALVRIGTEEAVQTAFQHVMAVPIEKTRHRLGWLLGRMYCCEDPAFLEKRPGFARQAVPPLRRCLSLDVGTDRKEHIQTVLSWLEPPARPEPLR